ncbi:MAG: hypothetical protein ACR2P0_19680 [Acidimicrobiales bacterium]
MPKYVFAYHGGGMPESEEEQAEHMAAWGAWFGANEGAFVDMGAPTGAAMTVGPSGTAEGGGANPLTGYGLVEAADMAAACAIAEGCPIVGLSGGSVQVAETFEVNM